MKKCKCGKDLIFKGGYVIASMRVDQYECYYCNTKYEQIEDKNLKEA